VSQQIELHAPLDVPAGLAREELAHIMQAMHERKPPYEDAALHVGLRDLRLPVSGQVGVSITTDMVERPLQYTCTLKIAASDGAELFPTFDGTIAVSPVGTSACELWMQGRYDVPFGALGAAIDATLFKGTAKRSLSSLLEFLAKSVSENVKRDQANQITRHRGPV
jgi:hypothetical protein